MLQVSISACQVSECGSLDASNSSRQYLIRIGGVVYVSEKYTLFCECWLFKQKGMKKSKHSYGSGRRSLKSTNNAPDGKQRLDSIDEDQQSFGGWLRSEEGMKNIELFVIANSIVILTTITFPHIQNVIGMISEALYGADGVI